MKLQNLHRTAGSVRPKARNTERGMAIIVVLALLSIILLYLAASARTLHLLGRDLRQVEQQQVHRLVTATNATASTAGTNTLTSTIGTSAHGPDSRH